MLPTPVIYLENKPVSDLCVVGTCNGLKILRVVTDITTNVDYDSIDEIFGVVNFADDDRLITTFVQVYSLASGSWKSLSDSVIPVDLKGGGTEDFAFVNDTLHKLEARFDEDEDEDMVIRTFNLSTEEFGEMMGPEPLVQGRCSIARYGDSLAFSEHYDNGLRDRGCDIWVMRQYGVAESWTKLFKVYVDPARIHGFKRCGDVMLEKRISFGRSRLTSYNPKNKQYSDLGTVGHSYYFMDSFTEGLVLLDHCNAISYQTSAVVFASVLNFQFSTLDMIFHASLLNARVLIWFIDWVILRTLFPPILRRASFAGLRSPTTPATQSFTDSLPPLQILES
ncbi:hypothetical protein ACLB2K_006730 [Fragaria x ananassa]